MSYFRRRGMGALGDDAPAPVEMTEAQYRAQMLASQHQMVASQQEMVKWHSRWVERDELQRWLQIGATLAIPLSAAIWKMIFRAGKRDE